MVTSAPLTTRPLAAALVVQPTVPLLPWSARHSHRSSPMTLALLICSVWVAEPTVAPPMRAKTSDKTVGARAGGAPPGGGKAGGKAGGVGRGAGPRPGGPFLAQARFLGGAGVEDNPAD